MTLRHPSLKFYGLVYAWYVKLNNQFANFIFNHFLLFQHFVEIKSLLLEAIQEKG